MKQTLKPSIVYWIDDKLYLNITYRCSNNCRFCIKNFRKGLSGFNLKLEKDPTISQVKDQLNEILNIKNWTEIVFCGFGEPTEKFDLLLEVTKWIKVILKLVANGGAGQICRPICPSPQPGTP